MLNPEYYLGEYRLKGDGGWQTAMCQDNLEDAAPAFESDARFAERRPLVIAPVPHESAWAKEAHAVEAAASFPAAAGNGGASNVLTQKRTRDAIEEGEEDAAQSMSVSETVKGAMAQGGDTDSAASRLRVAGPEPTAAVPEDQGPEIVPGSCMVYVSLPIPYNFHFLCQ
jgi:hypothetical protein